MLTEFYESDIRASYRFLHHFRFGCTELRAIRPGRGIYGIGYFDHEEAFVATCRSVNGRANLYVGIQPRPRAFLDRARNKLCKGVKGAMDTDIPWITALAMDVDPVRPGDTPSTEAELQQAIDRGAEIAEWLTKRRYQTPILHMSGNGCQLWCAIPPYPVLKVAQTAITERLRAFEGRIRDKFSDKTVRIDSIYNLSRIIKVIGTKSIKGTPSEDRPHRISCHLSGWKRVEDPQLLRSILAMDVSPGSPRAATSMVPRDASEIVSTPPGKTRNLDAWLYCLVMTDFRMRQYFAGTGKTPTAPGGASIDTTSSGYDFSLCTELIRFGVADPRRLARVLLHRPTGSASQKGSQYITRTIEQAKRHVEEEQQRVSRRATIPLANLSIRDILHMVGEANRARALNGRLFRMRGRLVMLAERQGFFTTVSVTRGMLERWLVELATWVTAQHGHQVETPPPSTVCDHLMASPPEAIPALRLICHFPRLAATPVGAEPFYDVAQKILYCAPPAPMGSPSRSHVHEAIAGLQKCIAGFASDPRSQLHVLGLVFALVGHLSLRDALPIFLFESAESPLRGFRAMRWLSQVLCGRGPAALCTVRERYRPKLPESTPVVFVTNWHRLSRCDPVTLAVRIAQAPHMLISASINPDIPTALSPLVCRMQLHRDVPRLERDEQVRLRSWVSHCALALLTRPVPRTWSALLSRVSELAGIPLDSPGLAPTVHQLAELEWAALFRAWWQHYGGTPVYVRNVNELCLAHTLLERVRGIGSRRSQEVRLGTALVTRRNQTRDGYTLYCSLETRTRRPQYRLLSVTGH